MRRWIALVLFVLSGTAACSGSSYCQSGPKHGTQCYSDNDLRAPGDRPPPAGDDKLSNR